MERFNKYLVSIQADQKVLGFDQSIDLKIETKCKCGSVATHLFSFSGNEEVYCDQCASEAKLKNSQLSLFMWFCLTFGEITKIDALRSPISYTIGKEEASKCAQNALNKLKSELTSFKCLLVLVSGCSCCKFAIKYELTTFNQLQNRVSHNERKFTDWVTENTKVVTRWNENKITAYVINDEGDIMYKFASTF